MDGPWTEDDALLYMQAMADDNRPIEELALEKLQVYVFANANRWVLRIISVDAFNDGQKYDWLAIYDQQYKMMVRELAASMVAKERDGESDPVRGPLCKVWMGMVETAKEEILKGRNWTEEEVHEFSLARPWQEPSSEL